MKKHITFLVAFSFVLINAFSQELLILQPDANSGKDARLKQHYPDYSAGDSEEFLSYYWTFSGVPAAGYSLIQFDISALPTNVQILEAKLSLYYPNSPSAGQAGQNACNLKRVTSMWEEDLVTWNTMPSTTSFDQIYLEGSVSFDQDYLDIDLLSFVQEWYENPQTNYGMMLQIIDESLYNSMKFCSSDYPNATLRPKLEILYDKNHAGVSYTEEALRLALYPNPNNGSFTIDFPDNNPERTVLIYNAIGKLIYSEDVYEYTTGLAKTFSINNPGTYIVKIVDSNKTLIEKMIVTD